VGVVQLDGHFFRHLGEVVARNFENSELGMFEPILQTNNFKLDDNVKLFGRIETVVKIFHCAKLNMMLNDIRRNGQLTKKSIQA
jgi:hypothetical protein